MQIDVSLDVFKALTARLEYDGQTFSDLISELLSADSPIEVEGEPEHGGAMAGQIFLKQAEKGGFASRRLWLPHGTVLRARYKQKEYRARIDNNAWRDEADNLHTSPSEAAKAITGTNVNGLRFWEAMLPGERHWVRLEALSAL
ncbi:DUF2924 domain-containing protein [Sphingomonas sp. TF3]|uniref:DUF2924 domain-containing protein n=1 Tax=Sphingomonas sp. TF3 TaxID=2495580 RepID=UPI000F894DA5|nr:DUF2924 domain-containing protein [Sphingomonas sp. TF3]RUN75594.1 DUF2924 domain-containing protein [Sphingomonas sp. TF3]